MNIVDHLSTLNGNLKKVLENGEVESAKLLLTLGARLSGPGFEDISPIEILMYDTPINSRTEMLRLVLQFRQDCHLDIGVLDEEGRNFLHIIASIGDVFGDDVVEFAQILLDAGVSLSQRNYRGYTPLYFAVNCQSLNLVSLFLKNGADVNEKCGEELVTALLTAVENETCNLEIVDVLLQNGADVNVANSLGNTVLHIALHDQTISHLLRKGANINAKNVDGRTPLSVQDEFYQQFEDQVFFPSLLSEIVKLYSLDQSSVTQSDINLINSFEEYEKFSVMCMNEIEHMQKIQFYQPYSYYFVLKLSKNIRKLANLTKNDEFVSSFLEKLSFFSIYKNELQRIFDEALLMRDQMLLIESNLKTIFDNVLPEVVIRRLAEYIKVEDIRLE